MKISPLIIVLITCITLGVAYVAHRLLNQTGGLSGMDSLPVLEFKQNPTNFIGNRYALAVQIDSQLAWREGVGRILAVTPIDDSSLAIPVFLPDALEETLHVGQRYHLRLRVDKEGLIVIDELQRY